MNARLKLLQIVFGLSEKQCESALAMLDVLLEKYKEPTEFTAALKVEDVYGVKHLTPEDRDWTKLMGGKQ